MWSEICTSKACHHITVFPYSCVVLYLYFLLKNNVGPVKSIASHPAEENGYMDQTHEQIHYSILLVFNPCGKH